MRLELVVAIAEISSHAHRVGLPPVSLNRTLGVYLFFGSYDFLDASKFSKKLIGENGG